MSDDPASADAFRWELRRSLVERLRMPWEGMGDMANQQRAEAAIQISTMMNEIEAWRKAMQKAERDIAELRDALRVEENAVNHLHTDRNNLRLEVERFTREWDEARREVCQSRAACIRDKQPVQRGDPVRAQMLRRAADVTVERGKTYGPPAEHFERTTRALHALMPDLFARPPLPEDWAKCMMIDKLARDAEVPKDDNCIDIAGYAACLYEVRKCDSSELV